MPRRSCDGAGFLAAFRSAVASLEANVDEINSLNVFPVPDGDTGTNMLATVRAALDEADKVGPGADAERVAQAASFGALMGARGNSGVISSQILAGMAHGLAGKRRFNGLDLAHALDIGTKTAYRAVAKPVEGTILTVIREASAAAVAAAERDNNVETVLAATVEAAERAVAKTPSLLPILREAHVVDSGGQGLFRLFQGALEAARGRPLGRRTGPGSGSPAGRDTGRDRGRGGSVRLRDRVPAPGARRPAARRPRDPGASRVDRRLGARCGGRTPGQGPCPQRSAGRGHRIRAVDGDAVPDHDREPRQPGARRTRGQGGGVRRRGRGRRDRSGARHVGRGRGVAGGSRCGPPGRHGASTGRGRGGAVGRSCGRAHRYGGAVPGVRGVPDRPRRPGGQPVDRGAARGGRGDPGGRAADPAQQPQRGPRRPAGRGHDPTAGPRGADAKCRRGDRGADGARPAAIGRGQRGLDGRGEPRRSRRCR